MTDKASPEFIAEAQEVVDALNAGLIAAEAEARTGEVEPSVINGLFRSAHSLKGISGMFGLEQISALAHALESVLDGMRLGRVGIDSAALDVLFSCVENFNVMIQAAFKGEEVNDSGLDLILRRLDSLASGRPVETTGDILQSCGLGDDVLAVLTEYEEHRLRENLRKGRGLFMLRTAFELSNFDVGLAELDDAVKDLGEVITKLPSSEAANPEMISFDIIVGSERNCDEISKKISDERVEVIALQRRVAPRQAAPVRVHETHDEETELGVAIEEAPSVRSVAQTVRVDIRRLDRLMNLVGELGLIRMALANITGTIRRRVGFDDLSAELHTINRNFERRLGELQGGIMEVRMVPLANLFERMVRVGRRMARELGREVRVELNGKHTELDKLIVEELADPLMHIIRNCIDHGIEPPADRQAIGKPPEGVVRLSAAALGNHVVVEISDDGRGIDVDALRRIGVERQMVTEERASELSNREALNMIFIPGFSTCTNVSEYSGRGVGLDVVKTNITKLSGVIEVNTREGRGSSFTITLPITLAIIPALVVSVAEETYAIPLNNVMESRRVSVDELRTIERREVLSVRGEIVPVLDLRTFLQLAGTRPDISYAVLVGVGEKRMALLVDVLIGHQDIVIKSLGKHLRRVPGIAGATELGNQRTILVIDTVDLISQFSVGQIKERLTG